MHIWQGVEKNFDTVSPFFFLLILNLCVYTCLGSACSQGQVSLKADIIPLLPRTALLDAFRILTATPGPFRADTLLLCHSSLIYNSLRIYTTTTKSTKEAFFYCEVCH